MHYENDWYSLYAIIAQRMKKAIFTSTFIMTFIGVIIVSGSAGIWIPYFFIKPLHILTPESFITYSISLLASVSADIILKDEDPKSLKMLFFLLIIVSLICFAFDLFIKQQVTFACIIGTSLVLSIWFVTNVNDDKYDEKQSANNPIGGEVINPDELPGEGA